MRTIASILSPETPAVTAGCTQISYEGKRFLSLLILGVEGDNELAIVRIASK
jgi:hypothetical protein